MFRLDSEHNTWIELTPMPHTRNFARAVLFHNDVYVVGGSPTAGSSHSSLGSPIVESLHVDCPK